MLFSCHFHWDRYKGEVSKLFQSLASSLSKQMCSSFHVQSRDFQPFSCDSVHIRICFVCLLSSKAPNRWHTKDPVAYQRWRGINNERTTRLRLLGSYCIQLDVINICTFPPKCNNCTALLLTNTGDPHFVSVDCNETKLPTTLCQFANQNHTQNSTFQNANVSISTFCEKDETLVRKECYKFEWVQDGKASPKCVSKVEYVRNVVLAVEVTRFVFVKNKTAIIILTRHYSHQQLEVVPTEQLKGFCILQRGERQIKKVLYMQKCTSGIYTSPAYVCNEAQRFSGEKSHNMQGTAEPVSDRIYSCSPLFNKTKNGCKLYLDHVEGKMRSVQSQTFVCKDQSVKGADLLNDLVVDCLPMEKMKVF